MYVDVIGKSSHAIAATVDVLGKGFSSVLRWDTCAMIGISTFLLQSLAEPPWVDLVFFLQVHVFSWATDSLYGFKHFVPYYPLAI